MLVYLPVYQIFGPLILGMHGGGSIMRGAELGTGDECRFLSHSEAVSVFLDVNECPQEYQGDGMCLY